MSEHEPIIVPAESLSPESRALIDLETAASEAAYGAEPDEDDGAPLPPHVKVSRPGWARAKVLEVLLNPEELEELEAIASERRLPARTVAREQLLKYIAAYRGRGVL